MIASKHNIMRALIVAYAMLLITIITLVHIGNITDFWALLFITIFIAISHLCIGYVVRGIKSMHYAYVDATLENAKKKYEKDARRKCEDNKNI